jgi:hypothetical protein
LIACSALKQGACNASSISEGPIAQVVRAHP